MKKGFTLPEAVICVGLVSIIAAVLVPGLIKVKPDEHKMYVKKAFSTTSSIISYLTNDSTVYSNKQNAGLADKLTYIDIDENQYSGNSKFCAVFASKMSTVGTVKVHDKGNYACSANFETIDGIKWIVATKPAPNIQAQIDDMIDQPDYITVLFKVPTRDASWWGLDVSRYGRISIPDEIASYSPSNSELVDIIHDVNANRSQK